MSDLRGREAFPLKRYDHSRDRFLSLASSREHIALEKISSLKLIIYFV